MPGRLWHPGYPGSKTITLCAGFGARLVEPQAFRRPTPILSGSDRLCGRSRRRSTRRRSFQLQLLEPLPETRAGGGRRRHPQRSDGGVLYASGRADAWLVVANPLRWTRTDFSINLAKATTFEPMGQMTDLQELDLRRDTEACVAPPSSPACPASPTLELRSTPTTSRWSPTSPHSNAWRSCAVERTESRIPPAAQHARSPAHLIRERQRLEPLRPFPTSSGSTSTACRQLRGGATRSALRLCCSSKPSVSTRCRTCTTWTSSLPPRPSS